MGMMNDDFYGELGHESRSGGGGWGLLKGDGCTGTRTQMEDM